MSKDAEVPAYVRRAEEIRIAEGCTAVEALARARAEEDIKARRSIARAMTGTPKTLVEALSHGINIETGCRHDERCALAELVAPYVRDFLSQRFGAVLLDCPSPEGGDANGNERIFKLWESITGEKL